MALSTPPPPVRSEDRRRRQLVVTKRRATGLLAVVGVVWIATTVVSGRVTWVGFVQATAEASLVGGLADWFAVTALFRRPLGLPIPHTAIIAERKDQFGATLGEFIQESFLTPATIVERVRTAAVVPRLADWLAHPDNAARVAAQAADAAVAVADVLRDDEIRDGIAGGFRTWVERIDLAPAAGRALTYLTADGRHDKVVDAGLEALDRLLDEHRDEFRRRFEHQSPWWLPGAVEDRIFERLLDGARAVVQQMINDPDHQLRRELDAQIGRLASELATSPDLGARLEAIKREVLAQPQLRDWAGTIWEQIKAELRTAATDPSSELRTRLANAVQELGTRLENDPALRATLERHIEQGVAYVAEHFAGEISALISATIARWDASETSRRLELLLGPDLQYIRINGTVVGGAAGLVLYTLARLAR
jgi:uncharacterized membrane-anchored protein YjiN (DUF445 family)